MRDRAHHASTCGTDIWQGWVGDGWAGMFGKLIFGKMMFGKVRFRKLMFQKQKIGSVLSKKTCLGK